MSALRSFLGWVVDQLGYNLSRAVLRALKIPKFRIPHPYEILSKPELELLQAAAGGHVRDGEFLAVLLGAVLRASATAVLDVQDLRLNAAEEWFLHVR